MNKISIKNRNIGHGYPTYVVAEVGNNHNGDINLAKELINQAKLSGADAVKFQVKDIESCFSQKLLDMPYTNENSYGKTYREHKQFLELSYEQYSDLNNYAIENDIDFFATPFDINSAKFLNDINVDVYKISSFHTTKHNLIDRICSFNKPIIMSTGMTTSEELDESVSILEKNNSKFALLHCVSSYPVEYDDVNLSIIKELEEKYNCVVGYSGHEMGTTVAACSIFFGASIIEKHFTLNNKMKGSDHLFSLEPSQFKQLVDEVKLFERVVGNSKKRLLECELAMRIKNL